MRNPSAGSLPIFSEMAAMRLVRERATLDGSYLNFIGAGAYEHYTPIAVSQLAAQRSLHLPREFQNHMAVPLALDAVRGGVPDGACALAEAIEIAVRRQKGARRVLMPRSLHPLWRSVVRTLTRHLRIALVEMPYDLASGHTVLNGIDATDCAALIIPQPNFFGVLEPVDALTDWAHARGLLAIGAVNPLALGLLKPPGEWGARGADMAVGDAQPLGMSPSSSAGFIACRAEFAASLRDDKRVHVSPVAAAHLAVMGVQGLTAVARQSAANAATLTQSLVQINGVERAFSAPVFHEFVIKFATPVAPVLRALKAQGLLGGIPLMPYFPELGQSLLVCATETKTAADISHYAHNMTRIIGKRFQPAPCAIKQDISLGATNAHK